MKPVNLAFVKQAFPSTDGALYDRRLARVACSSRLQMPSRQSQDSLVLSWHHDFSLEKASRALGHWLPGEQQPPTHITSYRPTGS
jgi:hypothetical protein